MNPFMNSFYKSLYESLYESLKKAASSKWLLFWFVRLTNYRESLLEAAVPNSLLRKEDFLVKENFADEKENFENTL